MKEIVELYKEVDEVDKATIINAIVRYIIVLEVDMKNVIKDIPDDVWDILLKRREEAILEHERLKDESLNRENKIQSYHSYG